jgi:hypothetical protein
MDYTVADTEKVDEIIKSFQKEGKAEGSIPTKEGTYHIKTKVKKNPTTWKSEFSVYLNEKEMDVFDYLQDTVCNKKISISINPKDHGFKYDTFLKKVAEAHSALYHRLQQEKICQDIRLKKSKKNFRCLCLAFILIAAIVLIIVVPIKIYERYYSSADINDEESFSPKVDIFLRENYTKEDILVKFRVQSENKKNIKEVSLLVDSLPKKTKEAHGNETSADTILD